jgi:hypothetical protein
MKRIGHLGSAGGVHVLPSPPEFVRRGAELFFHDGDLVRVNGLFAIEGAFVVRYGQVTEQESPLTDTGKVLKDRLP